jgi:hypothetical protein
MIEETATLDVPTERPKIIGCFQSDIEQEFLSLDVPTERPKIIGCFHSDIEQEFLSLDVPTERPKIIGCFQSDIEQEFLSLDVPTERPKIIDCNSRFQSDIEQENTILVFVESYKEGKRQKKNACSCLNVSVLSQSFLIIATFSFSFFILYIMTSQDLRPV